MRNIYYRALIQQFPTFWLWPFETGIFSSWGMTGRRLNFLRKTLNTIPKTTFRKKPVKDTDMELSVKSLKVLKTPPHSPLLWCFLIFPCWSPCTDTHQKIIVCVTGRHSQHGGRVFLIIQTYLESMEWKYEISLYQWKSFSSCPDPGGLS